MKGPEGGTPPPVSKLCIRTFPNIVMLITKAGDGFHGASSGSLGEYGIKRVIYARRQPFRFWD